MAGDVRSSVQFLQRRCQFIFPFIFSDPDRSLDDDLVPPLHCLTEVSDWLEQSQNCTNISDLSGDGIKCTGFIIPIRDGKMGQPLAQYIDW